VTALRVRAAPRGDELAATPEAFLAWLAQPTLFRVPGRDRSRTRVLATLLHGNEPSGLRGLHRWLRAGAPPAVDADLRRRGARGAGAARLRAPACCRASAT
jgi:hypothetical protein